MKKASLILLLILTGCAATPEVDPFEAEMYRLNDRALNARIHGNIDQSIAFWKTCISLKPEVAAIDASRPRRWCQNNLIAVLVDCEQYTSCQPDEAVRLAEELNFNLYAGQESLYYDPIYMWNLAKSYAAIGNYQKAVEAQTIAVSRMERDSTRLPGMEKALEHYRRQLAEAEP